MESVSSIVIAVVSVVVCIFVLYFISNIQKKKKNAPLSKKRATIIRDATKKLSQNPHNAGALNEIRSQYPTPHRRHTVREQAGFPWCWGQNPGS